MGLLKKQEITLYRANEDGNVEHVIGEVVEPSGFFGWVASKFNGITTGGDFERRSKPVTDGNGRVYNSATGEWDYIAKPSAPREYVAERDYQGPVPGDC